MKRLTVKVSESLNHWLNAEARRLGRSKSDIVCHALIQYRNGEKQVSLHDRMKSVCGVLKGGPHDLSTNPKYLEGFGG